MDGGMGGWADGLAHMDPDEWEDAWMGARVLTEIEGTLIGGNLPPIILNGPKAKVASLGMAYYCEEHPRGRPSQLPDGEMTVIPLTFHICISAQARA